MGFIGKLKKGIYTLELDGSGDFKLGADFVPPATRETSITAGGTSANRYGGASLVGTQAVNSSWSLSVRVLGSSAAEIEASVQRLAWMLSMAGDDNEPLEFQWRSDNNYAYEPLWGQVGAYRRVEIVWAEDKSYWQRYSAGALREKGVFIYIAIQIKPFYKGQMQRLGSAVGGVVEDTIGTLDGISRGLIVPGAETNLVTNPAFTHATYNTGWTASGTIAASENTDKNYLLFGPSSVKITALSTTDPHYYISITAANTNTHAFSCYAKRPDGSAIDANVAVLRYAANNLTTTYTAVGNGWYRLTATAAGVASAQPFTLRLTGVYTLYADGFQAEEAAFASPFFYGDSLGCAWSGTEHASTSTRTASRIRIAIAAAHERGQWSVRVVWKPYVASTAAPTMEFFDCRDAVDTAAPYAYFDTSDDKIYLNDGANAISTAAQTFAVGDIIVLHFVLGPGSLKIYKNGAEAATGSTYTPPTTMGDYVYIGTSYTPDNHNHGTFLDFTTYARAMSAAEALADYSNIYQAATSGDGKGQRVGAIPYLWTKDGDDTVDNCDDSARDNWCMIAGVPGDAPAVTAFDITRTDINDADLLLGLIDVEAFYPPRKFMFFDISGTPDVNCCGGEYSGTASGSDYLTVNSAASLDKYAYDMLKNRDIFMVARVGLIENCKIAPGVKLTSSLDPLMGGLRSITAEGTGAFRLYYTNSLRFPDSKQFLVTSLLTAELAAYPCLYLKWASALSNSTTNADYFAAVTNLAVVQINSQGSGGTESVALEGRRGAAYIGTTLEQVSEIQGGPIEMVPNRINILMAFSGDEINNPVITNTHLFNKTFITPRWSI